MCHKLVNLFELRACDLGAFAHPNSETRPVSWVHPIQLISMVIVYATN